MRYFRGPQEMEVLASYIERHAQGIFVREEIDGKLGSYALAELPVQLAIRHALRLLIKGDIPATAPAAEPQNADPL